MRSAPIALLLMLIAGLIAFGSVYYLQKQRIDEHHKHLTAFDWFCDEFDLTAEQRKKVEALHFAYFPECEDHCVHYVDTKATLAKIVEDPTLDAYPSHEKAASELARLEKDADKRFIDFIYSVASNMDPESAERYLVRMKGWLEKTARVAAD